MSSNGIKFGESSVARLVATAMEMVLCCDVAVVNRGAVRGKRMTTPDYPILICRRVAVSIDERCHIDAMDAEGNSHWACSA